MAFAPGTEVTFKVLENKRTDEKSAIEVKSALDDQNAENGEDQTGEYILRGTVILKKDSYGFIESEDHSKETFFHYSELSVKPEEIQVSQISKNFGGKIESFFQHILFSGGNMRRVF